MPGMGVGEMGVLPGGTGSGIGVATGVWFVGTVGVFVGSGAMTVAGAAQIGMAGSPNR